MELANLLTPECIEANLKVTSKKQALQEISKRIADATNENERDIFDVITEREKLGTTGVGDGIAIPHSKLETLEKLYGFFARLEKPINFDSVDERPVDLIFLLLDKNAATFFAFSLCLSNLTSNVRRPLVIRYASSGPNLKPVIFSATFIFEKTFLLTAKLPPITSECPE